MTSDEDLVVAAFDVDGTLTSRDCVVPFLVRVGGWPRLIAASLRHPVLIVGTGLGRGDRDRVKELVVGRLVRGRSRASLDELGHRFAEMVGQRWLRPDTVARMRWHRERGHTVVLVSASLRHYLEPLAERSLGGVDAVLCTDVETAQDGTCTGRLLGGNCRGPEKARRLTDWLDGRRATIWAYGDSAGDAELLGMADHAVRVKGITVPASPDDLAA